MTELPMGWEEVPLEKVCLFNPRVIGDIGPETNVSFIPMPCVSDINGVITEHTGRPFSQVSKGYTRFMNGDVIFAKITPCMENGKIAIAENLINGAACGSTEFHVLRPSKALDAGYLWRFLRRESFRKIAEMQMTGAVGQRRVPVQFLKNYIIPVPPLAEQERITKKLEVLFDKTKKARDELNYLPRLVERYKQAILTAAFSGDLTKDWRDVNKIEHYTCAKHLLSDVVTPDAPICYGVVQPGMNSQTGIPLIRVCDIEDGKILWEQLRTVSSEVDKEYKRSRVKNGDIVVTIVGTIGRIGIIEDAPDQVNIARAVARIRPNLNILEPKWLFYALQQNIFTELFGSEAREVARKTLNLQQLKQVSLNVPSIAEQKEIVRRIEKAFYTVSLITKQMTMASHQIERLNVQCLDQAFKGELVSQDPNDEPASILVNAVAEKIKG